MPMGSAAAVIDEVDQDGLAAAFPQEYSDFKTYWDQLRNEGEFSGSEIVDYLLSEDGGDLCDDDTLTLQLLNATYIALLDAVKTKFGLVMTIGYHDVDSDGDCYDEVDGLYFDADNYYVKNPALTMPDIVQRKAFTRYG